MQIKLDKQQMEMVAQHFGMNKQDGPLNMNGSASLVATTMAIGEEDPVATTMAIGEEC